MQKGYHRVWSFCSFFRSSFTYSSTSQKFVALWSPCNTGNTLSMLKEETTMTTTNYASVNLIKFYSLWTLRSKRYTQPFKKFMKTCSIKSFGVRKDQINLTHQHWTRAILITSVKTNPFSHLAPDFLCMWTVLSFGEKASSESRNI